MTACTCAIADSFNMRLADLINPTCPIRGTTGTENMNPPAATGPGAPRVAGAGAGWGGATPPNQAG